MRERCPDCGTFDRTYAGQLPAENAAKALRWAGHDAISAYPCPAGNGMWHVPRPACPSPTTIARHQGKVAA